MDYRKTKLRILDATEHLLAHNGYDFSMRSIADLAGVNIASINYHFGSKDNLIETVFTRRFLLLDELCGRELQSICESGTGEGDLLSVSRILRASLDPFFRIDGGGCPRGKNLVLVGRAIAEPNTKIRAIFTELMKPSRDLLVEMLRRALPDLPEEVLRLRLLLGSGALGYTLLLAAGSGVALDEPESSRRDRLLDALVSLLSAAMEAPAG